MTTPIPAPLHWGHGDTVFEVFIEPTCPFSIKAFNKLKTLLAEVGEDRMTLKLRLQSQPWHVFSGVMTRCVIAASTLENGREKAWSVLDAIGQHRDEFELENHCCGPLLDASPMTVIRRLEAYCGFELANAFTEPTLDQAIKWHCKYARQNGIHVSPSFMINGLLQPNMSSGDSVETWAEAIRAATLA